MRLAVVSTILSYRWGGADTLWTHAAEAADKEGSALFLSVSPTVAAHARVAAMAARGAVMHRRTAPAALSTLGSRLRRKFGITPSTDTDLVRALRSFSPQLVLFSQGGAYDIIAHRPLLAWLRQTGTKYRIIVNFQNEHPHLDSVDLDFVRETFIAADALYFVSTRNLVVTRRHLLAPLLNASIVQNPLRWQSADISPWPAAATARLATVSRLDDGKGLHLLLHALAEIGPSLPRWQLDIFGRGPTEAGLREIARRLGLDEHVRFRGHVASLRDIWAENHLMVSPALDDGVPMTIPEAMLCQRPVLAVCVGGAEDWLSHNVTGFLSPAPTVPLLAKLLYEAFLARDRWQMMGLAAAASAFSHYRPDDVARLLR